MNLSINGHSQVPPGFRFHPTEEELLHYYLRKKVAYEKIDLDVIQDVDLNKLEPWDIQEKCKIGSTPQNDWYFFSHKDKKYPTGTRTNRATAAGFWKATGRDKIIYSGFKRIGLRKTLVFYKGRAPHGRKSDWIMHEYRLDENHHDNDNPIQVCNSMVEVGSEEGWVVCRVFRKKNYLKSHESPKNSANSANSNALVLGSSDNNGVLDQILLYMGRTCKLENDNFKESNRISFDFNNNDRLIHLPRLESPTLSSFPLNNGGPFDQEDHCQKPCFQSFDEMLAETEPSPTNQPSSGRATSIPSDWAALDRLVASQLNGLEETSPTQLSCLADPAMASFSSTSPDSVQISQLRSRRSFAYSNSNSNSNSENDLWGFSYKPSSPSSSDPLCHLSV